MKKITYLFIVMFTINSFAQNIVNNGDFSNGLTSWTSFTASWIPVSAVIDATNNEANVTSIVGAGSTSWHVQLNQVLTAPQIATLTVGQTYKISFDARAAAARPLKLFFGEDGGGFAVVAEETFNLNTTMANYQKTFILGATYGAMKLGFEAGLSNEALYIDNVKLELVPPAPVILDLLLGFETAETGGIDGGPFGNMAAPVLEAGTGSNTSRVLKFVGNTAGDVWQGINLNLTSNVNLTTTQTMTIDVKSATPIYFLSKVTRGLSGAPEAAASVYHNGDNTWQTLTFVFNTALDGKAVLANGVYQGFVIHAYWANGATTFGTVTRDARTFYVDNIRGPLAVVVPTCTDGIMNGTETGVDCGGTCPACPQPPTMAAPTPPARPVADVLSVFSNAYANVAVTEWGPNWGLSSTVVDAITIATDPTKRANMTSGKTFFGIVLTDYTNLTDFTHFHMDYWVPSPVLAAQVLSFKLSNHATQAGETSAIETLPTPTAGSWVSVDVPLSSFTIAGGGSALRNNIKEIVVSGARENNVQTLDFYFDNLYFHKNTILATDSFSALNIKMYPNPAANVLNIEALTKIEKISVYNMLGQEVISKSVGVQSISLDVSNLQSGMYIIKTNIDGVTAASRFAKQ